MSWTVRGRPHDPTSAELIERLRWLLKLRWLLVPIFVAVDLASGLLEDRSGTPWATLAVGGFLLAANVGLGAVASRPAWHRLLLPWARVEAYLVVALPVLLAVLHGDADSVLRYGVLVGVVGAAAVLPRPVETGLVAVWALLSLVLSDALSAGFDPARLETASYGRWVMEAGLVAVVALLAAHLQTGREWATGRARAADAALHRAQDEWDATFDFLAELVVVTDREGRVVRANRAFAVLLGKRPHELVLRPLRDLLAGHPERWWASQSDGIVEVEDPVFDTTFEITCTTVDDRLVRVARDVGEQRRLHARIVQADKLAAVGVLASGVAHELNNPSAFVGSNLTELQRYLAAYESAVADLAAVGLEVRAVDKVRAVLARHEVVFARREAGPALTESLQGMERIRQLVTHLRSLSRNDQVGEPAATVELAEVVEGVVRIAAADLRSAAARIDVRGPVHAMGHRGELVDVVLNLVVNAVQARAEGRPNQISVELLREGPHALVRVTDTGKGISPTHMKRLFEPFFTTKAPGEGTGLGLSLARKIVLAHGGSIDVASEVGRGSCFSVRLPLLDASSPGDQLAARRSGAA
ncbi:MAG: ATP-binding protein [Anaeromyxobacter sp.]